MTRCWSASHIQLGNIHTKMVNDINIRQNDLFLINETRMSFVHSPDLNTENWQHISNRPIFATHIEPSSSTFYWHVKFQNCAQLRF